MSYFCSCWSCQSTMLPKSHVQVHRSREQARKKVPEVDHHFKDKVWSGRHSCLFGEDLKAACGSCSGYKQLTHTPCHHTRAPAIPPSTHCNNSTNTCGIFPQVLFHPFQFQELSGHVEGFGVFFTVSNAFWISAAQSDAVSPLRLFRCWTPIKTALVKPGEAAAHHPIVVWLLLCLAPSSTVTLTPKSYHLLSSHVCP